MLFSTAFGDRPGTVVRRPAPGGAILSIDIVRKLAGQVGFTVLPRRWVVERTAPGGGVGDREVVRQGVVDLACPEVPPELRGLIKIDPITPPPGMPMWRW